MQVRFLQGTIPLGLPQILPQTEPSVPFEEIVQPQLLGIIVLDLVAPGLRGLFISLITLQPLEG